MGGEKFDTPHPEGYLFGENMDLNSGTGQGQSLRLFHRGVMPTFNPGTQEAEAQS